MDYCCTSWYSGLSCKLKDKLDVLQRKMVRYVLNLDPRAHVGGQHLRGLHWLSINDRVRFFKLIHVFKVFRGLAPSYVSKDFKPVSLVHNYRTRHSVSDFFIPSSDEVGVMSYSFRYSAAKAWNDLPPNIKMSTNVNTFKANLRSFLFKDY